MKERSLYNVLIGASADKNSQSIEDLIKIAKQNTVFDVLVSAVAENKVGKLDMNLSESLSYSYAE
jgi:hypothetical protein